MRTPETTSRACKLSWGLWGLFIGHGLLQALPSLPHAGDVQLSAVFRHGTTTDGYVVLFQLLGDLVIGQGLGFVFITDDLGQKIHHPVLADSAVIACDRQCITEKTFQWNDFSINAYVFVTDCAGYRGYMVTDVFCDLV